MIENEDYFSYNPIYVNDYFGDRRFYSHYKEDTYSNNLEETLQYYEGIAVADKLANKKTNRVIVKRQGKEDEYWHIEFENENTYLQFRGGRNYPMEISTWLKACIASSHFRDYHFSLSFEQFNRELQDYLMRLINNYYPIRLRVRDLKIDRYADPYKMSMDYTLRLIAVSENPISIDIIKHHIKLYEHITMVYQKLLNDKFSYERRWGGI